MREVMRKFLARKTRVNAKIKSSYPDFRIVVDKSNMYIRAQVLDTAGNVTCFVSDKGVVWSNKTERSHKAWEQLAELMKKKWIEKAAFDRNGYVYHGRVKALADWIRKWGIAI